MNTLSSARPFSSIPDILRTMLRNGAADCEASVVEILLTTKEFLFNISLVAIVEDEMRRKIYGSL